MKVQKRPRSSIRARRTACFSVSSSSRYMSLTSCRALSSWGCRSPFPGGVGRRGRAGDPGPACCIRGSGPMVVSLAAGLGTAMGARELGRAFRPPGLVEGLVPRAGKEDRQTRTQERHQSCKTTQDLEWAESWATPGPPLEQLCSGEPRGDLHPKMVPSRLLGGGWKQDKVEHGAQLSSRPRSGELELGPGSRGGGVSVRVPTQLREQCTRTATVTPRSSERDRERREDDGEEW